MISISLSQVYLISKRTEIIVFFEKLLHEKCPVKIYSSVNFFIECVRQESQRLNSVVIVDCLSIASPDEIDFLLPKNIFHYKKFFLLNQAIPILKSCADLKI